MHGMGLYSGNLDNYWGTASQNALITFQANNGLSRDGCAGPNTWAKMQSKLVEDLQESLDCRYGAPYVYQFAFIGGNTSVPSQFNYSTADLQWYTYANNPTAGPVVRYGNYQFSTPLVRDPCANRGG